MAREDTPGQKKIIAYVTQETDNKLSNQELVTKVREACASNLPDYMLPSQIMLLDELPLTPNGKIDRKSLPIPEGREGISNYKAPQGLLEIKLAKMWSELLGIEEIGRNDNFFHLGGHSLLATRLVSQIRNQEYVEVPLKAVFEHPTLHALAKNITQKYTSKGILPPISLVAKDKPLPLSYAQQRLWFIEQLLEGSSLYHVPLCLRLEGKLNNTALKNALNYLVSRHEILRTKIISVDGVAQQEIIAANIPFRLKEKVASREQLVEIIQEEIEKPFKFEEETLCRGLLIELSGKEHVLVLTFHHINTDAWSIGIFSKELSESYASFLEDKEPLLPVLHMQYGDYSVWQREWLQGEVLDNQLSYWKKQLEDVQTLQLPTDRPRPEQQSYTGGVYHHSLPRERLEQLKTFSKEEGVTLFMTLLTAFQGLLSRYTNQTDIVLGSPIANRRTSELEGLIGFFVNTLVLRISTEGNPTFRQLVKRVEKMTLETYEHQDVPFEQLVDHLNIPRDLSRHPIFQVMFGMENFGDEPEDNDILQAYRTKTNLKLYF